MKPHIVGTINRRERRTSNDEQLIPMLTRKHFLSVIALGAPLLAGMVLFIAAKQSPMKSFPNIRTAKAGLRA
jgi:hypothetical protein